jgi:hypothetical protein
MVAKCTPEQGQFGNFQPASQYRNPDIVGDWLSNRPKAHLGRVILPENR